MPPVRISSANPLVSMAPASRTKVASVQPRAGWPSRRRATASTKAAMPATRKALNNASSVRICPTRNASKPVAAMNGAHNGSRAPRRFASRQAAQIMRPEASARGSRAAAPLSPKSFMLRADSQYCSGGFSK